MRGLQIAALMVFAGSLLLVQQAQAATVTTAREDGTTTETFRMGENVRIIASSEAFPFNVVVEDPDGVIAYRETVYIYDYDKVLSTITSKPGWWEVRIEGGQNVIREVQPDAVRPGASRSYLAAPELNSVPEVPLGTIMAFAAFFAALGVVTLRKRATKKPFQGNR